MQLRVPAVDEAPVPFPPESRLMEGGSSYALVVITVL
jgi:hypothetical protein